MMMTKSGPTETKTNALGPMSMDVDIVSSTLFTHHGNRNLDMVGAT
jgi:hypothetical protein